MVYASSTQFFFTSKRADLGFGSLKHGDIVSAKILSLKAGGSARIFFNGTVFEGRVLGNLKEGDALKMRVAVENGSVLLIPETERAGESRGGNLFSKLGLPKNELTSAILAFFTASGSRLEEERIGRLIHFLKDTKKDKTKAAFAGGLLESRGLELDESIFERIYALVFGDEDTSGGKKGQDGKNRAFSDGGNPNGGTVLQEDPKWNDFADADRDDTDIFALLNHTRGNGLHWIVLPFKKDFSAEAADYSGAAVSGRAEKRDEKNGLPLGAASDKNISGSLSLLLDLNIKTCRTAVLRCKLQNEKWIFSLQDKTCFFMQEDAAFSEKEKAAMCALLVACLAENGVSNIAVTYGSPSSAEGGFFLPDLTV